MTQDTTKICATCKYVEPKGVKKGTAPSKIGYCYGHPPMLPGNFRVQIALQDRACSLYQPKK